MNTILGEDIILVLTESGYVASYDDVSMLFWDQRDSKLLVEELSKRFKGKPIHVLDDEVPFENVERRIQQYLQRLPGVEVCYMLEQVNLKDKTGVFRFRTDREGDDWKTIPVSISNLLLYKLSKKDNRELEKGDSFLGTEFKSKLNSESFRENPFRLVEFLPGNDSDIPHNYRLELVYETFAEKMESTKEDGSVEVSYQFQKLDPTEYRRYECHTVNKKRSECREKLVIAPAC